MDWYKHSTGSHDDPDISDAMDEFGHAGYSVFFICLEIYGQEYNHLDGDGWLTLSGKFLSRKLRLSQNKVEDILYFYSERGRILIKTSTKVERKLNETSTEVEQNLNFRLKSRGATKENTKNTISFKCTKFIDIASNWTKRKGSSPTEGLQRTASGPTAKEEEEKKNKNIYTSLEDDKSSPCPHEKIIELYHKTLPELAKVKVWTPKRQSNLRARWTEKQERQNLDWWRDYFLIVKGSAFLTGNVTDWKADLEWIINQSNMVKILEGKYNGGGNGKGIRTNRSDRRDSSLQSRAESELEILSAQFEASKALPAGNPRGDAVGNDVKDFEPS